MSAFLEETVLSVHHWTDRLFSFTTTPPPPPTPGGDSPAPPLSPHATY
ncbi:MAG: hypothetical protein U1D28_02390 [Burkholderiales bacterium]|nr:hypothetical protein [Burkholderiales bacterium]